MNAMTRMGLGAAVALAALGAAAAAQQPGPLPLEPIKDRGQGVSAAYEGWYRNSDGSFSLLIGYFNRNRSQPLDIPVGPNNRVEPGGPDRGQPTHFLPRRQWGVFTIRVPKDFGAQQKITWTIVANGEKNDIPMSLHPNYEVMPFKDPAMGNLPPVLKFDANGPSFQGPPSGTARTLTATVGQPTPLVFYASDDAHVDPGALGRGRTAPPVTVFLSKFRGPGAVTFSEARPRVALNENGRVEAIATFATPGDYIVRIQANDNSGEGGGGFQCCWTNTHVAVTVSQ